MNALERREWWCVTLWKAMRETGFIMILMPIPIFILFCTLLWVLA